MTEPTEGSRFTGKYRALLLGGVAVGILILAGLVVLRPQSTCEGIFEQTAPHLEANLEIIRSKGALAVGQEKIQELAESAQKVGLHLKTCCSVLSGGSLNPAQFQQCVDSAAGYDRQVAQVAQQVSETASAQSADKADVEPEQRAAIAQAIDSATRGAEGLERQVAQLQPATTVAAPAAAASTATSGQESEPNNNPTQANNIALGDHIGGTIQGVQDMDFIKITATKPVRDRVRVALENLSETLMPTCALFNQNKSQIGGDHYDATAGANLEFAFTAEAGAVYYLRVSSFLGEGGAYRLQASYQNAADAHEPNEEATQATMLSPGQPGSGNILDAQDRDWYQFQAGGGQVRIRLDNASTTLMPQITLYDDNRAQIANTYNTTPGASIELDQTTTPGRIYYIKVVPFSDVPAPADYRISVNVRNGGA